MTPKQPVSTTKTSPATKSTKTAPPAPVTPPAATAPVTPPGETADPVPPFVAGFVALALSLSPATDGADLPDLPDSLPADLLALYRAIPGVTRGRAAARGMSAAIRANADSDRTADLGDMLDSLPAATTRGRVAPSETDLFRTRLASLLTAGQSLPVPADLPTDSPVRAVLTALSALSLDSLTAGLPDTLSAVISPAAVRAVSAVTRGQSGPRGPVTQRRDSSVSHGSAGLTHVNHVMANAPIGQFMSTREIAAEKSPAYPADARPSASALANVVRDSKTLAPVTGAGWQGSSRPDGATRTA